MSNKYQIFFHNIFFTFIYRTFFRNKYLNIFFSGPANIVNVYNIRYNIIYLTERNEDNYENKMLMIFVGKMNKTVEQNFNIK